LDLHRNFFKTVIGYTAAGVLSDTFTPKSIDFLCAWGVRSWSLEEALLRVYPWDHLLATGVIYFDKQHIDSRTLCAELVSPWNNRWGVDLPNSCLNPNCRTQGRKGVGIIRANWRQITQVALRCFSCASSTDRIDMPKSFARVLGDHERQMRVWRPRVWRAEEHFVWHFTAPGYEVKYKGEDGKNIDWDDAQKSQKLHTKAGNARRK
jgi:hypothetical protein